MALNEVQIGNAYSTECRHERGVKIPDDQVVCIEENNVWHVKSQSDKGKMYVIKRLAEICMSDHCMDGCLNLSCCGLCMHFFHCSCGDKSRMCKHIHKIQSMKMRLTVQETSDSSSSRNQPFEFHEAAEIGYVQDERANDISKERVKSIMNQIMEHLESSKVQQLLMPHIEGVMMNVLKQCESLQPSSLDKVKQMPQTTMFSAAEKIQTQVPPMNRLKKRKKEPMLPKIPHDDKLSAQEMLIAEHEDVCFDNQSSDHVIKSPERSENKTKLKLKKRKDKFDLNETSAITIQCRYSEDVHATVLKISETYKLSLLHIKSLESSLPNDVSTYLHSSDPSFTTGWIYDMVIDSFMYRLAQTYAHVWFTDTVVASALLNGCSTSRTWQGVNLAG